jgi:hypothetical protein
MPTKLNFTRVKFITEAKHQQKKSVSTNFNSGKIGDLNIFLSGMSSLEMGLPAERHNSHLILALFVLVKLPATAIPQNATKFATKLAWKRVNA